MTITAEHTDFLSKSNDEIIKEHGRPTLIFVNPPWAKIGTKFIQKCNDILEDGGQIVGIMDYNKMTRHTTKTDSMFKRMMAVGHFNYISTDVSWGAGGYFHKIADNMQFVYTKGIPQEEYSRTGTTTIKNRTQQVFQYKRKGIEQYIPQIPDEDKFFDWENGIKFKAGSSTSKYTEDTYAVFVRILPENCKIEFKKKGEPMGFGGTAVSAAAVNEDKLKDFVLSNSEMLFNNYVVSHGWPRFPPVRKELIGSK